MTREITPCTLKAVRKLRSARGSWYVAILAAAASGLWPALAHAQAQTLTGLGPAPIVRVVLGSGEVNVRTWDRSAVEIDDPSNVTARRFSVEANAEQSTIPILAGRIQSPNGPVELPEESFAVSTLAPGPHDVVAVRGQDANITVMVPRNAALVTVQMGKGNISLSDYRQGTFVTRVRNGSVHLQGVGGDGYVQVMRGPISADASSFNRLRMRSGTGDITFGNCHSKQIEVTSVRGSIDYDGGTFEPGLARFESQSGSVGLGVSGGAQLAAHATGGRVLTAFDSGAQVSGHDGEQEVSVGGGGPLVTASSGSGSVYLYNGQLASHHVSADWQPLRTTLQSAGRPVPSEAAPVRAAAPHNATQPPVTRRTRPIAPAPSKVNAPQPRRLPPAARPPAQMRPRPAAPRRAEPIRQRRDGRAPAMRRSAPEAANPGRRAQGPSRARSG